MRKVVYIIPGFTSSSREKPYPFIGTYFNKRGIEPFLVNVKWDKKAEVAAMPEYVADFITFVKKNKKKGDEVYVLGFSFGAMIAYITAHQIKPKALILCSISPMFREDLKKASKSWHKYFKKVGLTSKKMYSAQVLAKGLSSTIYGVVGSREVLSIMTRLAEIIYKVGKGEVIVSKNSTHDIRKKAYLNTVKEVISRL